ncbi:MAG: hypothetical protein Q4B37_08880 [Eubacteriales bacterium]|nr:hypothetical protein [Eubacteriales bacterium]
MNTKEALQLLIFYLGSFSLHPQFLKELQNLLKKELKGKESRFFKLLVTQLKNIQDFGVMVHTVDSNEKIQGLDGHFYSIHFSQSQFNIRFLIHISDDNVASFLSAFYERGGKKATDYSQYTSVLLSRLKDMEGNYNE